ncbi:Uma2 family endonuclease [Kovacikia minuta CCNUW1]|uniref:Uma2 family endonuclease n=1 Tax=Kovacikia minuta TaxID=2931930 RepID=UPI001CCA4E10|nr:Uma2 family endonuclease [Kovacikia minuta]UBF23834.1 Uma2 family endonuclease [Kovacikia minuta CCNUW1]
MTTRLPSSPTLSLEEFLRQPETKPASEYIDGRVYQKPMPQGKHSRLQTRFPSEINRILEPPRLGCAFTELRCTFGGRSLVPDITVFEWGRIPLNQAGEVENQFLIYPDWTIEILSPDQRPTRVINNILFCLNHGTQLGWLIDPEERTVIIFQPNQQPVARDEDTDQLTVLASLGDWQLTIAELFSWLSFASG